MKVNLSFLKAFGDWLDLRQHQKISNCGFFFNIFFFFFFFFLRKIHSVPSVQCSTGTQTLRCLTNLINILLNEQYQFVLTERLQVIQWGGGWASIAR